MTSTPFDMLGIPEEILKECPPTTPARGAARRKADDALEAKYPGQNVAYVDTWTGDVLDRVVVANASEAEEFQQLLAALDPSVRDRVELDFIDDPEEGIRGLYPRLAEPE